MKTRKIWANFSVQDAQRSRTFYTQLGFRTNGSGKDPNLASFLFGDDDFVIHFFQRGAKIDDYLAPGISGEVIFTLAAHTEAEVQEWAEQVKNAGGTIFQEAGRDDAGYYGFGFADPDGHKFNVLLMEGGM